MESNVNIQDSSTVPPNNSGTTCNSTYASVLSKGKPVARSSINNASNNNPNETKPTDCEVSNSRVKTDGAIVVENNLNSTETFTPLMTELSQSDSFEDTDDSQLAPELPLVNDIQESIQTLPEADSSSVSYASLVAERIDEENSEKDINESQSSGEYTGSADESDTEDGGYEMDDMYRAALKWKFRPSNPVLRLPETVTVLDTERGSKVFLVGTAHFSLESQEDVAKTIKAVQPDVVMVELCKSRVNILSLDEATILEESKNMNFQKIKATIEQNGFLQGVLYLLLLSMSAHLTKQLGMAPGGEFRRAFTEAIQVPGCLVHLGDRPIHTTLQRALATLKWWQKLRIAWYMLRAKDPISKEEVERCKQKDLLEEMLAEMTGEFPELSRVFVKERDIYLTYSLQMSADRKPASHCPDNVPMYVVGVVGIGHVPGIVEMWGKVTEKDVQQILSIPEATLSSKVIRHAIRISLLGLGAYGVYRMFRSSLILKKVSLFIPLPFRR